MRALVIVAAAEILVSCTFPSVTYEDASLSDAGGDAFDAGDAGDDADPCDQDHDGYRAEGGACGGNDCNDHDPRANPDAGFVYDVPDSAPWGDWNCDGFFDKQYTTPISCTLGLACNTAEGYLTTNAGCGIAAPYYTCAGLCSLTDAGTRTQGCR